MAAITRVRYVLPRHKAANWVGPGAGGSPRGRVPAASSNSRRLTSWTGWPISCRRRGSTGIAITGCSPRITSSGPPSRPSRSGMSSSGAMPRLVGMRSADMRRTEMPPPTVATHATNQPSHDTSRIAWAKLMARVGEEFPVACPGCGGDIRRRVDRRQEPAHFEPEVRKREKARMASPA